MEKDPVCGMEVEPTRTVATAEHKGENYFFCSEECRTEFIREPEKYAKKEAA